MSITYYRDASGVYLGAYGDGVDVPVGAIECPVPEHALANWNGSDWDEYIAPVVANPADVIEYESIAVGEAAADQDRLFVVSTGDDAGLYLNQSGGALKVGSVTP